MVRVKGHFDGAKVVLDEDVPEGIATGTSVEVTFLPQNNHESDGNCESFVDSIRSLIGSVDGPPDLSEEHDHYAHGAPKRSDRNA